MALRDIDIENGIATTVEGPAKSLDVLPEEVQPGMILPWMDYPQRLFHYTYASSDENLLFMEFKLLQRLNITEIQNDLAKCKASVWKGMSASRQDMINLRTTLGDYSKF